MVDIAPPEAPTPTASSTTGVAASPSSTALATTVPVQRTAAPPAPQPQPQPQPACPTDFAVRGAPSPHRPRYVVSVSVDPDAGTASGELAVTFTPDLPTDRLVFRLWPNGPRLAEEGARLAVTVLEASVAYGPIESRTRRH